MPISSLFTNRIPAVSVEGIRPTVSNIGRLRRGIREANKKFVLKKAAELWTRSTGMVPYNTGALYRSAFIREISSNAAYPQQIVGYDPGIAPYAMLVHEITGKTHPTRGPRPEPKRDHYLSEPRDAMAATFDSDLRNELVATIRRMTSISSGQKGGAVRAVRRGA